MEYKNGDVILFEADDRWISRGIALLTNSNVSHSAMMLPDSTMVEMGPKGIQCSKIQEEPAGEPVFLLRLDPEQDSTPLVQAANRYLEEGVAYDFPNLILLAGLLIYRAVRPTPRWRKITDLILNVACVRLDRLLNRILHKGKKVSVMMCSQFVYQCYLDCGKDYAIILKNALLQDTCNSDTLRLIDIVDAAGPMQDNVMTQVNDVYTSVDVEALSQELCEAIEESKKVDSVQLLGAEDLGSMVPVVQHFLSILEQIMEASGISIPVPAMFVAPCDLLHAENLTVYGKAVINRVRS